MQWFYPMLGTYLGSMDNPGFRNVPLLTGRLDQEDQEDQRELSLGTTEEILALVVDFTDLTFFSNTQINHNWNYLRAHISSSTLLSL